MRRALLAILLASALTHAASAGEMLIGNLVCFVRFSDQQDLTRTHSFDDVNTLMNAEDEDAVSVWRYYHDTSYGALSWKSVVVEVDYCDSHPRGYFCPQTDDNPDGYTSILQGYMREQAMIRDLCKAVESSVPADAVIDGNKDWEIDNMMIVALGNSDPNSSSLLWPHQNTMTWASASIHDCDVESYLLVFDGANGAHALNPGVMCHEMMHALGAYDLYSNGSLNPVGKWDLMSDNQTTPQGMTAYMRHNYGRKWGNWIPEIKTLTEPGTYTINPIYSATADDVAYIIKPDQKRQEYFMVEYRRKEGWDATIPSSGLVCYRINPDVSSNLSASKFEVYVFRPDGSTTAKGSIEKANFNATVRRAQFGVDNTYYPFYTDGTRADFALTDIGKADADGITFTLSFPTAGIAATDTGCSLNYDPASMTVRAMAGTRIGVYAPSGMLVASGTGFADISHLPYGVYILRGSASDGSSSVLKIRK